MRRRTSRIISKVIIPLLIIIAVAAVATGIVLKHRGTEAEAPSRPVISKPVQSEFLFTGAAGWYKGPSNQTSMALFSDDHSCFTSIEHKSGAVNVATMLQKQQSDLASSGATMAPDTTLKTTVQTSTGNLPYVLHQFRLSGGEQLMQGLQLGYIQLSNGYLEIQGHCNTASQLPSTIPALRAYKYSGS